MAKLPVKANTSLRHSAQALKQYFLDNAEPLVQQYINAAVGTGDLKSTNADARTEVWDVLKQMMLQASDKIAIDIKSAEDVIKAVTDGKCTFKEGQDLLTLYKTAKDIETSGKISSVGGTSGLVINILSADKQPKEVQALEVAHNESTQEITDAN